MDSITPRYVDSLLGRKALDLCQYLLPAGKKNGDHWKIGNSAGDKGQSMTVYLNGNGWCDYADFETGSYIDLWMQARGLDFKIAYAEAKAWLGIYEEERKKEFKKPIKPASLKSLKKTAVREYLNGRGLSDKTIDKFMITECELLGNPAAFYPYMSAGELTHFKQISIVEVDGKKPNLPSTGTKAILFGWQTIPEGRLDSIIITEGEIDAMTYHEYGFNALSVPFGGGDKGKQNWVENEYINLSQFNTIYLSMDMDKQGELGTEELIKRLGIDRCRIIKLPHKDANDCKKANVQKEVIQECIDSSKYKSMAELKSPVDFLDETLEWMFPDESLEQSRGFDTPWSEVNPEWRPMWGELTLINGINAHGKSEFANLLALHAAMQLNIPSFVASMEIPNKRLNERFIKQLTASTKPCRDLARKAVMELDQKLWIGDFQESMKKDKLLEAMSYAHKRYGVKVFLIDSLMKCGVDEEDNSALKGFVEELCEFKNNFMVHIFLVVHPRKGVNEETCPNKMDVLGTGGVTNLADNLITIWRNKKREQAEKDINFKLSEIPDHSLIIVQARQIIEQARIQEIEPKLSKVQSYLIKAEDYLDSTPGVIAWLQKHRNGGNERQFKLDYKNNQHINFQGKNKNYVQLGVTI